MFRCFGVWVWGSGFWVLVCRCHVFGVFWVFWCSTLMTFWKVKRVTREGGQKMAKIQCGVKPDIFKITEFALPVQNRFAVLGFECSHPH